MTTISMRLPEKLAHDIDSFAKMLHVSRTTYILTAVEQMNTETMRRLRKEKIAKASIKVRKESMKINAEFSRIENDPAY